MKFKCMIINDTEITKQLSFPKHNHFYFKATPGEQTEVTEVLSAKTWHEAKAKYINSLKKKGYGYLLTEFKVKIERI